MCSSENHKRHERDAQLLTSFQTSKIQKLFFFALSRPSPTLPPAGSFLFVWPDKLLSPSLYTSGVIKENIGSDDEPQGLLRSYRLVEFPTLAMDEKKNKKKQAGSFFNENFAIQRDTQFCTATPTVPRQRRPKKETQTFVWFSCLCTTNQVTVHGRVHICVCVCMLDCVLVWSTD